MTTRDVILWVVVPYVCLAVFVLGHVWRYRYDKFGWTTLSSQLYESRLLRWASPMFHFGILFVFLGHVMGLGVPESWTSAVGISDTAYHALAISVGTVAGVCTVVGMALLIYRRRTVGPVFRATTRMDKVMYVFLAAVIGLGMWNTVAGSILNLGGDYDYREGVSVWFHLPVPAAAAAHGRGALRVPGARHGRDAAVRAVAVHAAGARVQRTGGVPVAAVRRLPGQGARPVGDASAAARVGAGRGGRRLAAGLRRGTTDSGTAGHGTEAAWTRTT